MAALVLSAAGGAAGSALFGPIGAIGGRLVGALVGSVIDQTLFGGSSRNVDGPRLSDLDVMSSSEGAPIPHVYGRARLAGQVIWATQLEEVVSTDNTGGGKAGPKNTTSTTTYTYFANFAVGLCEGEIGHVARIWADGKPLDLTGITYRIYPGSETQTPDPLIVAKEGDAPAYRGHAYVVFERLPLANFGNRIPQLSFEVIRPIGRLERMIRAVALIPGTTEFGYEPATIVQVIGPGQFTPENRHVGHAASDVLASLDDLQASCPNLERVAIVVAWFGNDLRAEHCVVQPGVESQVKATYPATWSVAGVDRGSAYQISLFNGRSAYGGTPDDASVSHLIAELKARGLKVTLYPFLMLDVPGGNTLSDPWTGASSQPAYPWRGHITCDPAPGQSGTPDASAAAAIQVDAFFGIGAPDGWNYRRLVLHYAQLAADAGGVDAFLIGSELKSLTRVRSASGVYPAVARLSELAGDVKAIVGSGTIVTYGADWTEYSAHVVDPGANEVRFPLDALWTSSAIDVVGIDYYAPLADWRDDAAQPDRTITDTIYDPAYLAGNLRGGEAYDWYYVDDAARAAQTRSDITNGLGKPWIFRVKDLWNWWSNPHYERVSGSELGSPTGWTPQGKPIWLTEVGCPAVDKGANQPSTFPDPKSSDGGVPYFSEGSRDDLIQRRYLEAVLGTFDAAFGATSEGNPTSSVYGAPMIDAHAIHLWSWDSRPYPVFPAAVDVWSDGPNWETGHWLTGRVGSAPLDALVATILSDADISDFDTSTLTESVDGYVIDRPMPPRAAIDPLALAYAFDAAEVSGLLAFRPRGGDTIAEIAEDDLILPDDSAPARLVRTQETELPREVSLSFTDGGADYRRSAVTSRRLVGGASRTSQADLAVVTSNAAAERRADIWLQDLWAGRESAEFALPPSMLALAPGDVVGLTVGGRRRLVELRSISDTDSRAVKAQSIDPGVFDLPVAAPQLVAARAPAAIGPAQALILDLPTLSPDDPPVLQSIAVFADPWPGAETVWRSPDGESFARAATAVAPATVGVTLDDLPSGPTSRFDHVNTVRVQLYGGGLASVSDMRLFGGANAAAVQRTDGAWEVLQFANADLVADRTYRLSRFLRGQAGTEWAMGNPLAAGAPFVILDEQVIPLARGLDSLGRPVQLRIIAAGRDYADPAALSLSATPISTALRPLSPVHLTAVRTVDGVAFSWIRRTRINGDAWEPVDVPLGEESEAYALDILSGSTVKRTLTASTLAVLYAAADELADFGAPQTSLSISIAQLSTTVGRGYAASGVLTP